MQFITPLILIATAIGTFFFYTLPTYKSIGVMESNETGLTQAIDNAIKYRTVQDGLSSSYRTIKQQDIDKLHTMIPDTIDNVRLVIDLEKVAIESGLVFKKAQYQNPIATADKSTAGSKPVSPHATTVGSPIATTDTSPFGSALITFTVSGPYEQFVVFLKKLEKSLRLIDVVSVTFNVAQPDNDPKKIKETTVSTTPVYEYTITIKAYWLKN